MTKYETQGDLDNEARVMQALAQKYNLQLVKCPERYRMDAVFIKGKKIHAFVEFKRRSCRSDRWPTMFVSLSKAMWAEELRRITGIPVQLVVEWEDRIGAIDMRCHCDVTVGGRSDRNDPNDYDLVAHYKIDGFKTLDLF